MPSRPKAPTEPNPAAGETSRLKPWQRRFLQQVTSWESVLGLLKLVPCCVFFIKDRKSRIVWTSRECLSRFGPRYLATKQTAKDIVRDDRTVMRTHRAIPQRAEVWYNERHSLDWLLMSKRPLFDRKGKVIGVIGFVENSSKRGRPRNADPHVSRAVAYIEKHHHSPLKIHDVAVASGVSQRQLLRRFRKEFGVTLREFILKVRIQAASDALLYTDETIAAIASTFCFCDQSSFTRQFRRIVGITPKAYQRKFRQRAA